MSRAYLGEFEHVVLLALARLPDGGHGASIHREILGTTGRDVSIPAVYVTLKRMEAKALVASSVAEPSEGAGRPLKEYRLLAAGDEALARSRALLERLWSTKPGASDGAPA